jgi:selenocysteine lyase/cysteine desulfurase
MLQQIGVQSFIRLSGSHYNTPLEIERFLEATAKFAPARRALAGAGAGAAVS